MIRVGSRSLGYDAAIRQEYDKLEKDFELFHPGYGMVSSLDYFITRTNSDFSLAEVSMYFENYKAT